MIAEFIYDDSYPEDFQDFGRYMSIVIDRTKPITNFTKIFKLLLVVIKNYPCKENILWNYKNCEGDSELIFEFNEDEVIIDCSQVIFNVRTTKKDLSIYLKNANRINLRGENINELKLVNCGSINISIFVKKLIMKNNNICSFNATGYFR